jgi:predicted transcriptional regulator
MTKGELLNHLYKANLPMRATLVMNYLINRANQEPTCFPAIKTIASDCNISKRTVQRALNDLLEAGMIKKESRYRENGGQSSNLYTICINEHDEKQPSHDGFENYIESIEDIEKLYIDNISFSDYLGSNDENNESDISIDDEILEDEEEVVDKIFCVDGNIFKFKSYYEQVKINEKITCHREGDNLVPP